MNQRVQAFQFKKKDGAKLTPSGPGAYADVRLALVILGSAEFIQPVTGSTLND